MLTSVRVGCLVLALVTVSLAQPEKARELNELGLDALTRGDFGTAFDDLTQALAIWRSLGPEFERHKAIGMINLGDAYCSLSRWAEGQKLFVEALEINRRLAGPKHLATVANLNRVANVHVVQGELADAERMYME